MWCIDWFGWQQVELTEAQKKLPDELKKLIGAAWPDLLICFDGNVGVNYVNSVNNGLWMLWLMYCGKPRKPTIYWLRYTVAFVAEKHWEAVDHHPSPDRKVIFQCPTHDRVCAWWTVSANCRCFCLSRSTHTHTHVCSDECRCKYKDYKVNDGKWPWKWFFFWKAGRFPLVFPGFWTRFPFDWATRTRAQSSHFMSVWM